MTMGASDNTGSTFSARNLRRSSGVPSSVKLPSSTTQIAMTEIVLAAGVKANVLAHLGALRLQKSHQTTGMIVVAMADDQRIHLGDIDLHESRCCWRRYPG